MKYSDDGPFQDPVVRCDSCTKLMLTADLKKHGMCPHCGNRRVRKVLQYSPAELEWMETENVDPEFLALFEGAE